jgi:hypothetical protein
MSTFAEQYYQINFLRLFKLAKSIGAVNRKRKMPSNYPTAGDSKKACDRLFKTFLAKLFGGFEITSEAARYNRFYIHTSSELQEAFQLFQEERDYISEHHSEAFGLFTQLTSFSHAAVGINDIYRSYITVNLMSCRSLSCRDYFETAKACVAFKALWDNTVPQLIILSTTHNTIIRTAARELRDQEIRRQRRAQEEARRRDMEERLERERIEREERLERERVAQEEYEAQVRRADTLRGRVAASEEQRRANSQASFNDALERWRVNNA